jgi:hypothetical protein
VTVHHFKYPAGTILFVRKVPSLGGGPPKDRSVVLITALDVSYDDEEAGPEDVPIFSAVAITGEFDRPIQPPCVEMEYAKSGRCGTGLTKPSVANCAWAVQMPVTAIVRRNGYAGDLALQRILSILAALDE